MRNKINVVLLAILFLDLAAKAHAAGTAGPQLRCHRTANEDVPENTLESLEQAELLGCNVVEIDLRRTLDGVIILNHDGFLERLTDGTGRVEDSFYSELTTSDAGSWMGERFAGMRVARFDDALSLARTTGVRLVLDIKTPGIGEQVVHALEHEDMLERVEFNGAWADVKKLKPQAHDAGDHSVWVRSPVTAAEVTRWHREGKAVIANFSESSHEMDLDAMKGAVAAGVDAINVDYPRLGAEAVGKPLERTIAELTAQVNHGDSSARSSAILQLARYRGFPLRDRFVSWLEDRDPHVARAAALALLGAEYHATGILFASALKARMAAVRANAAWALGRLRSADAVSLVEPLLTDEDAAVRAEAYLAVSRLPGSVSAADLRRGLSDPVTAVRGAAALAVAQHPTPETSAALMAQLQREMDEQRRLYEVYRLRDPKTLNKDEIASVTASYRCQMQMVRALAQISGAGTTKALEQQAFRANADFSQMNEVVAAFALWDRVGIDPLRAPEALGNSDSGVADRAEWMLVHAGPEALPVVRAALQSPATTEMRLRAIRIVSLSGDVTSLPLLRAMSDGPFAMQAREAIARIEFLQRQ